MEKILKQYLEKEIKDASVEEIYNALLKYTKDEANKKPMTKGDKKLYYISCEFLIGKLLSNNLINLGVYDEVAEVLKANGKNLAEVEEFEPEPSLGNGGLGRLAACFLDSIATLGLNGDGIGLNYHYGLFKQVFKDNKQYETPNPWIEENSWLTKTKHSFTVPFNGFDLKSTLYDIDVIGYNNGVNKLHLFDVDTVDETIVKDSINFDKTDIEKNLTLFLYPDDSDQNGQLLRIYQQYFMVSNAAQYILSEYKKTGFEPHELDKHVAIQINDTHPSMVIPELIRLLMEEDIDFDRACEIVTNTCAYTNHTILAEALEKWPIDFLEKVVPHLMPIIRKLDERVNDKYNDPELSIIDEYNRVHMARMDMHYGHSINGVAYLHTEILKHEELKPFYDIYPEKFNNKTNGITFRRWLLHCNKPMAKWLDEKIGGDYRENAENLEKLLDIPFTEELSKELLDIKAENKQRLVEYIEEKENIKLNPNSIFDIQVKRLHEYKRQQMNVLYIIHKYLEIKKGNVPSTPITFIFGAKAAPAYIIAKDIIHTILTLQKVIDNDPVASKYIKLLMVENYNVSYAEKLIPASDISEQISLASKEASGTGNMKFMLNGAVTLGTEDGANVEIHNFVGDENIYIFGKDSDTIIDKYKNSSYRAVDYYIEDEEIRDMINFIISPEMMKNGDPEMLLRLHAELIKKDWFMTLIDLKDYILTKERAFKDYENRYEWSKKMLTNIAKAGYFSSDRTIAEYNKDIWHLK